MKMKNWHCLAICVVLLSGCTTIGLKTDEGVSKRDFDTQENLCVCIYKDNEVTNTKAQKIIAAIKKEFNPYGISIHIPWVETWQRPGFTWREILTDLARRPLEEPCDRQFAIVGRNFGDFLWGVVMPEMHGAVDLHTMSKGFAVAELGSMNQLLTFKDSGHIAAHEIYHLLGCGHGIDATRCYDQIIRIKIAARQNREVGRNFFPAMKLDGQILWSREEINETFRIVGMKPDATTLARHTDQKPVYR